jgi:hypothetical protein
LNRFGAAEIDQRIQCGPGRAPRVEHIIHKNDGAVVDREYILPIMNIILRIDII